VKPDPKWADVCTCGHPRHLHGREFRPLLPLWQECDGAACKCDGFKKPEKPDAGR